MTLKPSDQRAVNELIKRALVVYDLTARARDFRHFEFTLTDIATGTGTTQAVTWNLPILSNYSVICPPPTAAAAVLGLVTAGVQAGSKTALGCTLIIANRTGVVVGTAAFDVLAFPL